MRSERKKPTNKNKIDDYVDFSFPKRLASTGASTVACTANMEILPGECLPMSLAVNISTFVKHNIIHDRFYSFLLIHIQKILLVYYNKQIYK